MIEARNYHLPTEHDACGIVACVQKNGTPSPDNVDKILEALIKMSHRAGFVDGEGDGCGILMDIPRRLWAKRLTRQGIPGSLADDARFFIGHLFIRPVDGQMPEDQAQIVRNLLQAAGGEILLEQTGHVNSDALGPQGRADEPVFWQIAGLMRTAENDDIAKVLFELHIQIEKETSYHVASLNKETVVYKVRGSAPALREYYLDLQSKDCRSAIAIGHNRYSTNTSTVFERVQPFTLLGHNGEINTIKKLREETEMIGIPLVEGGSDSQDLNRSLEGLIHRYGCSLFEAMEMMFPPIVNEIKQFQPDLQDLYMFYRSVWGPFAQGPAGIVSRYGDHCLFGVDALGLRPLWCVETEQSIFFSSEQGIVPMEEMICEPKSLAPGEKIGVFVHRNQFAEVIPYHALQRRVLEAAKQKYNFADFRRSIGFGTSSVAMRDDAGDLGVPKAKLDRNVRNRMMAALAFDAEDLKILEHQMNTGAEPIQSLGYDGPLAALSRERQNIADYFKETVAVVTNPAIDREREIEHFSTRVVLGPRPHIMPGKAPKKRRVELQTPLLLGGHSGWSGIEGDVYRSIAHKLGSYLFEDLLNEFQVGPYSVYELYSVFRPEEETIPQALERLQKEAVEAVVAGSHLLVIDDCHAFTDGLHWLDPHLVVSAVDLALKYHAVPANAENLRRRVSIVLRSAGIRNLHDIVIAIGLGADAVNPYMLWEIVSEDGNIKGIENAYSAYQKGLEKVISTIGIHELRGYDRLFSSIGLREELARMLGAPNFYGSKHAGMGFEELLKDAMDRYQIASGSEKGKLVRPFRYYPRVWKAAGDIANGNESAYQEFFEKLIELEKQTPISLRHALDIKESETPIDPADVDLTIGMHSLPFLISSMSFGSQSETAFRAYAEAAFRLNMISLNGEGGEIKDMLGKYPNHRGHQIASGRFGVNVELCNSSNLLEIKIGQGAKPGEGGHLPGSKVSVKVAAARNAQPGIDLISPSNNHDIYSIEDLAQMIDELKTINPNARVSVKVPVVPNIGTIAVGIAKAGADIITLSGYDGGTGAARSHALKHVGLPVEIGVAAAHRELIEAGLRDSVEIWCDGGLKTGIDVLKMILLGANRAGFGTMAMVAVGCTSCRGCHKDTCHVGIATQMDLHEAKEKGLKSFVPREFDLAVSNLMNFFDTLGEELKAQAAKLGAHRLQDLVGRVDLLQQAREFDRIDLADMLQQHQQWQADRFVIPSVRISSVGKDSLTEKLAAEAVLEVAAGSESVAHQVSNVSSHDRVLGTFLSGSIVRAKYQGQFASFEKANVKFDKGSIAGNGFAAYNGTGLHLRVEGGAQDGVGKTSFGGKVIILKGKNKYGQRLNGSVGKGLGYGAQRGLFIVQGNADSRAGIRLSGADMIFGGQLAAPVQDQFGMIGARANIKGFAFEYMTNGRAIVLGDPGPWICSGMTGGTVYLRLQPELGLDVEALRRRIAKGAKVTLQPLDIQGKRDVVELLTVYKNELVKSGQTVEADMVQTLMEQSDHHFMMIKPGMLQTDQDIATE
ncbi:glutamate synthase [Fodinisporobacter ferrooxydans]|uniref:Glutamate synthase n=1 Tax=Fodinisporobacter ferrooxydans TaxID=2901836 RepID=A0ABY4CGY0_9BACL|nr:glutamate synthase [Alicyclobacillaceae bacterium MYW30-H2]